MHVCVTHFVCSLSLRVFRKHASAAVKSSILCEYADRGWWVSDPFTRQVGFVMCDGRSAFWNASSASSPSFVLPTDDAVHGVAVLPVFGDLFAVHSNGNVSSLSVVSSDTGRISLQRVSLSFLHFPPEFVHPGALAPLSLSLSFYHPIYLSISLYISLYLSLSLFSIYFCRSFSIRLPRLTLSLSCSLSLSLSLLISISLTISLYADLHTVCILI